MSMMSFKIDCVVGARPNFVKIAPIMRALSAKPGIVTRLIHTGQHYDFLMNAVFFEELRIPAPAINLEVGSGSGIDQIAKIMIALEPIWIAHMPELVIVVGDVYSTLAAALAASKLRIPVAHVEAGLRSFDRAMPEEINRLVTDRLSDLLFVTEPSGMDNLRTENVPPDQVVFVGNVMIDTLYACLERAVPAQQTFAEIGVTSQFREAASAKGFGFATMHRPSNVDDAVKLDALLKAFMKISNDIPLVFAIHPRTRAMIASAEMDGFLDAPMIASTPPLSYLRAIGLMREARFVATDSGGIQEETTVLGVPCLTIRDNTERPITIAEGTNTLIGTTPEALLAAVADIRATGGKTGRRPILWDGKAAERIADAAVDFLSSRVRQQT